MGRTLRFQPCYPSDYHLWGGHNFSDLVKLEGVDGQRIDLIESRMDDDPRNLIFAFHSTIVCNTWDGVELECYYPNITLREKNQHMTKVVPRTHEMVAIKWKGRGFEPVEGTAIRNGDWEWDAGDWTRLPGEPKPEAPIPPMSAKIACSLLAPEDDPYLFIQEATALDITLQKTLHRPKSSCKSVERKIPQLKYSFADCCARTAYYPSLYEFQRPPIDICLLTVEESRNLSIASKKNCSVKVVDSSDEASDRQPDSSSDEEEWRGCEDRE